MKTALTTVLSVAAVLGAATGAFALNQAVLTTAEIDDSVSTAATRVLVPRVEKVLEQDDAVEVTPTTEPAPSAPPPVSESSTRASDDGTTAGSGGTYDDDDHGDDDRGDEDHDDDSHDDDDHGGDHEEAEDDD